MIIHAVGLENVEYNGETFGPVFNKEFLEAVFHLQESIKGIGAGTDHALEKICIAPLRLEGQKDLKLSECIVQSIWGYYQDDDSVLEDEEYLDHFLACSQ